MHSYSQARLNLLLDYWRAHHSLPPSSLPAGKHNRISDVPGIRVGHATLSDGDIQTGFTAIIPGNDNHFTHPLPCAAAVLNGFGKSAGLVQIEELGTLETPILLTNTLAVGTGFSALVAHAIDANPDIGREQSTVNPVVLECNDGYLNDIQRPALTCEHARQALICAESAFARGAVGAGRGMSCFGLKGGIGTASRTIGAHTLGVLVLANFGRLPDLRLDGLLIGPYLQSHSAPQNERGSIILVIACDAPLDARQLKRIARRTAAGLGRTGSHLGHGSGDIALAFSTCRNVPPLADSELDDYFRAAADATEYAVLDALLSADGVTGFRGHSRDSLRDCLNRLAASR